MNRRLPDLVLLGVAVVWGGSYLAAQDLAAASSAAAVMCLRFVPSAVLLMAVSARRDLRGALRPGIALGVLRAATIALETVGVTLTSATNAGLLIALSVLLTPLLESMRLRRRVSPQLLGSVSLALLGIALLVGGRGFATPNAGDLLILGAALTRAALGVAEARVTARAESDVLALTTVEITFCAAVFTAWGGAQAWRGLGTFDAAQWTLVAYLALGCTVFAFLGQLWATKHTSASRAGLLLGTEPIWALLVGVTLAGDALGPLAGLGAVVLFVAIAWGRRAERTWREGVRT